MQSKDSSQTIANLMQAFAGESQANRKYLAFAKQAEMEGYNQVAKLFRAAANAETVHALSHLRATGQIGTTEENLKAAIAGETFEYAEMYPPMINKAQEEENSAAHRSFTYAHSAEIVHASLFKQALAEMGSLKETDYYVCSVCGYTCSDKVPDACPVCGSASKVFSRE
jgi:rubrerythrin